MSECIAEQIAELELLESMYDEREIKFEEKNWKEKLKFGADELSTIEFCLYLRFPTENTEVELTFHLPVDYPLAQQPAVYIRSSQLNCSSFNDSLRQFVSSLSLGAPVLSLIIEWVKENYGTFRLKTKQTHLKPKNRIEQFARFWIFSHHIYSEKKRKNLVSYAADFHVKGFSMPGKPGVICVEGRLHDCQSYWEAIKRWNWQKLVIKHEEKREKEDETFSKFDDFKELIFEVKQDGKRMDLGEFREYLSQKDLAYVFGILFDIEMSK